MGLSAVTENGAHLATIALLAMVVTCAWFHAEHEIRRTWRRLKERMRELGPGRWRKKIRECALALISLLILSSHVGWYVYELLIHMFGGQQIQA